MAIRSWLSETARIYIGNATSVRDFRVQMRGPKPFWFFSFYVACLCLIGLGNYWSSVDQGHVSIIDLQARLASFFTTLIGILAATICLVAPGLTGTAIVAERQRQSLDLVTCAPVSPKYLLVGKMISSYRYTWMLLILALPVVSMSVVLGGASWTDVFGGFALLSLHALSFTSLSLLISCVTNRPASAVIWSLLSVIGYVAAAGALGSVGASAGGGMHGSNFFVAFNPFEVVQTINSVTDIGRFHVPNWCFTVLLSVITTRFFLLAGAVTLAPLDKKLAVNLRLSGLVMVICVGALIGYAVAPVMSMVSGPGSTPGANYMLQGGCALVPLAWLLLGMPLFACFGSDASRRFWQNGNFSVRNMLDGTPAGGLPYALAVTLASFSSVALGIRWGHGPALTVHFLGLLVWALGLCTLTWSLGRLTSYKSKSLRSARSFHLALLLTLYVICPMVLSMTGTSPTWAPAGGLTAASNLWYLWVFAPLTAPTMYGASLIYGLIMVALGAAIAILAPGVRRTQYVPA